MGSHKQKQPPSFTYLILTYFLKNVFFYKINKNFINFITNLKQMIKKRALVNSYKDIILVTRLYKIPGI